MGELIFKIIRSALKAISPTMRDALRVYYRKLEELAAKTETEWDDLFLEVLGVLLGIDE